VDPLIASLGLTEEIEKMRLSMAEWLARTHLAMQGPLGWQIDGKAKHFRPATVFACYRSVSGPKASIPPDLHHATVALELVHNVSLIVDDILDRSRYRRGKLTLHCRFGSLPALMAAGYMFAGAVRSVVHQPETVNRLCELLQRLGVAECVQWDMRRAPEGVRAWRELAAQDTGSMFEICASLSTGDDKMRKFGLLLGMLYHGCDDVGDVRGAEALGGGGKEDLRDGILTLPAAIAIQDQNVAEMFASGDPKYYLRLQQAYRSAIREAEDELETLKKEALLEIELLLDTKVVREPRPLHILLDHTRSLSKR
jgi:geranylgeranyl diphosphate synthase type I